MSKLVVDLLKNFKSETAKKLSCEVSDIRVLEYCGAGPDDVAVLFEVKDERRLCFVSNDVKISAPGLDIPEELEDFDFSAVKWEMFN